MYAVHVGRVSLLLALFSGLTFAQEPAATKYPPLSGPDHIKALQLAGARDRAQVQFGEARIKVQQAQNALDKAQAEANLIRDNFARAQMAFMEWVEQKRPAENCVSIDADGNWTCPEEKPAPPAAKPPAVSNGQGE